MPSAGGSQVKVTGASPGGKVRESENASSPLIRASMMKAPHRGRIAARSGRARLADDRRGRMAELLGPALLHLVRRAAVDDASVLHQEDCVEPREQVQASARATRTGPRA